MGCHFLLQNLPNPGIEPGSPALQADSLPPEPPGTWDNLFSFLLIFLKMKVSTSPSSMHGTGHSKPVHWDDPEGWDREGGGSRVQDGGHMYTHG